MRSERLNPFGHPYYGRIRTEQINPKRRKIKEGKQGTLILFPAKDIVDRSLFLSDAVSLTPKTSQLPAFGKGISPYLNSSCPARN